MGEQYNNEVSRHYSAYRPPVHQMILEAILSFEKPFQLGLDIGCGTGVSTVALSKYCHKVYGVDPSEAMLAQTRSDEDILYRCGSSAEIPLPDQFADIVTFAGSLSYAKSDALISELQRVCIPGAQIIVYDFEVLLDGFAQLLEIPLNSSLSDYDHGINFSDCNAFIELMVHQDKLSLPINSEQLAHVLFSSSERYRHLVERLDRADTFSKAVECLSRIDDSHQISIDRYYSVYRIK